MTQNDEISLIVSENELHDLKTIGQRLYDMQSSVEYLPLVRPKHTIWKALLIFVGFVAMCLLIPLFPPYSWFIPFFYIICTIKLFIVATVRIYQQYAPDKVRWRCRCRPSCSEYTIKAIQRHGVLRGGKMALRRIRGCGVRIRGDDPVP